MGVRIRLFLVTMVIAPYCYSYEACGQLLNSECTKLNRDSAFNDIKLNHIRLFLQSGDPPITYTGHKGDKWFSKKYNITFDESGDLIIYPFACIVEYNTVIFAYFDKKYGQKWRTQIRVDVPGLKSSS